jgi:hypothetical protein
VVGQEVGDEQAAARRELVEERRGEAAGDRLLEVVVKAGRVDEVEGDVEAAALEQVAYRAFDGLDEARGRVFASDDREALGVLVERDPAGLSGPPPPPG